MEIKLILFKFKYKLFFIISLIFFNSCKISQTENKDAKFKTNIDYGIIRFNNFGLFNNVWGKKYLDADSVYNNSLGYENKDKKICWEWNWLFEAPKELKGYPSFVIGDKPFKLNTDDTTTDDRFPVSIKKINKLIFYGNFNAIGDGNYNYAFDFMILNDNISNPDNIKLEIMIWLKSTVICEEEKRGVLNINGFFYDIYVNTSWNPKVPYVAFVLRGNTFPKEIPIHKIFNEVEKIGFNLDNSYLSAVELGVEIWTGHGVASLSKWKLDLEYK